MSKLLRKKQSRKQGLKILTYGVNGSGKSVYGLSFPDVAILDAEAKVGVYENSEKHGKNIVAVADTSSYYDCLDVLKEVIEGNVCKTFMVDSETYIYEAMQVSAMEVEEERAKKKGGDPTDQAVSQRGWGKVKLNTARFRSLKAQASAKGITLLVTAHKEDIMQKVGNDSIKVGEKPSLRKNSEHEYDVILRFFKDKDLATGKIKYLVEVEKDTTETYEVGTIIENPCYENTFKNYIESSNNLKTVQSSYDTTIDSTMNTMNNESKDFEEIVAEFESLFQKLKEKDVANVAKVKDMLVKNGISNYKKPESFDGLKVVIQELKNM